MNSGRLILGNETVGMCMGKYFAMCFQVSRRRILKIWEFSGKILEVQSNTKTIQSAFAIQEIHTFSKKGEAKTSILAIFWLKKSVTNKHTYL